MASLWLLSVTLCFFAVKGSLLLRARNIDNNAYDPVQNIDWLEDKVRGRPQCSEEMCGSIIRLLTSKRTCLSTCLRVSTSRNNIIQIIQTGKISPDHPTSGLQDESIKECIYSRCFQPGGRIRKDAIMSCISGACDLDDLLTPTSSKAVDGSDDKKIAELLTSNFDLDESSSDLETRRYPQYPSRLLRKRGYTDPTDICIQYHCSQTPRGTLGYIKCLNDNRCNGR